jgi:hypothetical protein
MSFVRQLLRWLLAVLVVTACAAQPIALDACRAACDSARSAQIAAAPPCHHAAAASQIGQPARPSGQEHAVVPASPSVGGPAPILEFVSLRPPASLFDRVVPRACGAADSSAGPPPIPISLESTTPLRV